MEQALEELKSALRSLVVSSPTQMDMRTLMRDYREMMGQYVPFAKYGYRDFRTFLDERCSDCFVIGGPASNPVLTLIVNDNLKHIDKFVQSQKISSNIKARKCKRRSVPETVIKPRTDDFGGPKITNSKYLSSVNVRQKQSLPKATTSDGWKYQSSVNITQKQTPPKETTSDGWWKSNHSKSTNNVTNSKTVTEYEEPQRKTPQPVSKHSEETDAISNKLAVQNFLQKRNPLHKTSQFLDNESDVGHVRDDDDSGRLTASSGGSGSRRHLLEETTNEVKQLMDEHPQGIWSADILRLYKERFGRELSFSRLGYSSMIALLQVLHGAVRVSRPPRAGDWLLTSPGAAAAAARPLTDHSQMYVSQTLSSRRDVVDPDDALPGLDFDPDVFPADCMHFVDSIPPLSLDDVDVGAMLDVVVGEVYSPSHLWLLRLGERYDIAMEALMDEMSAYYTGSGDGAGRALSVGAARVGQHCAALYERDWHRAIIVKRIDCDTFKVRHVDYGTVSTVPLSSLKPLLRRWSRLAAQAVRARLGGVRPGGAGRRWQHAAATHLLALVRDKRLVATVVQLDRQESILEVYLTDTSSEDDVSINEELVRSGHADRRHDSALHTSEAYLYPTFTALESGDTPNYQEIGTYLQKGIALEYVPDYTRHVPPELSPSRLPALVRRVPSPSPSPPSTSPEPHIPSFPLPHQLPKYPDNKRTDPPTTTAADLTRTKSCTHLNVLASSHAPVSSPSVPNVNATARRNLNRSFSNTSSNSQYFNPQINQANIQQAALHSVSQQQINPQYPAPYQGYPPVPMPGFPMQFFPMPPLPVPYMQPQPFIRAFHRPPTPSVNNYPHPEQMQPPQNACRPMQQNQNESRTQFPYDPRPQTQNDWRPQNQTNARPQTQDYSRPQTQSDWRLQSQDDLRPVNGSTQTLNDFKASCANLNADDMVTISSFDVDIFMKLCAVDEHTAGLHMSEVVERALNGSGGSAESGVALRRLQCAVFQKLMAMDGGMAVKHLRREVARSPPRPALNPDAQEFRINTAHTQTEPVRPPPGFEHLQRN